MLRLHVKVMYPIITREGLMNRRLTILWLWMYVNRTCFVDFFDTVKRGSYMYGHTYTLTYLEQAEIQEQPKGVSYF